VKSEEFLARKSAPGPDAWRRSLALGFLLSVLAGAAFGQDRELGFHLGLGLGDFHGCPAFGLEAAFPVAPRLYLEAEAFYYFNPEEAEKNPPVGFHQSSMAGAMGLGGSFRLADNRARFIPFLGAGLLYIYSSVLTDRPPAARIIESRSRLAAALAAGARVRLLPRLGLHFEARGLALTGGGDKVLRISAGFYTNF